MDEKCLFAACCVCGRDSPIPGVKYVDRVLFLFNNGGKNWCAEHAPVRVRIKIAETFSAERRALYGEQSQP